MQLIKTLYYALLHLLTLGKGIKRTLNGISIVFPTRYYKYYHEGYEKESFQFIKQHVKPGNLVLDVGGHIGLYAISFAKLVGHAGKVYTFEPTPSTNGILRETIKLNGLQKTITVQNEAISKQKGETYFYISDNLTDNSNSLVNYEKPRSTKGIKVRLLSIDDFARPLKTKIDFIKIDVEGAELDAVLGAKETMLRDKPWCILAIHPHQIKSKGDSLEEIWDVVAGYKYTTLLNGKEIDKSFFCKQSDLFDVWLKPPVQ